MATISHHKSLDQRWYAQFVAHAFVPLSRYFNPPEAVFDEQERLFRAGDIASPDFGAPRVSLDMLNQSVAALEQLSADIDRTEENPLVRDVYCSRISEIVVENKLVRAAASSDTESFFHLSQLLYPLPRREVVARLCADTCTTLVESGADLDTTAAQTFLTVFRKGAQYESSTLVSFTPPTELFERARAFFERHFASVLECLALLPDSATPHDLEHAMNTVIALLHIPGWQAHVSGSRTVTITVDHERRLVLIPARRVLSRRRLRELVMHEVVTHVLRRHNGETSRLHLLGIGLDRYLQGEEGIALLRQQLLYSSPRISPQAIERYLGIALAVGLVDGVQRDFRGIYEIMKQYYFLLGSPINGSRDDFAHSKAWNLAVRLFRGASPSQPGMCYTKDVVYLDGLMHLWGALEHDVELQRFFDAGKFDPSNSAHVAVVTSLVE